jgi:hypothetical protein
MEIINFFHADQKLEIRIRIEQKARQPPENRK